MQKRDARVAGGPSFVSIRPKLEVGAGEKRRRVHERLLPPEWELLGVQAGRVFVTGRRGPSEILAASAF